MTDSQLQPSLKDVLREYSRAWMQIPGVTGIAAGLDGGRPCVRVFVDTGRRDDVAGMIPNNVSGFPVTVEESAEIDGPPPRES